MTEEEYYDSLAVKWNERYGNPSQETLQKLIKSKEEAESLELKVLKCPICGFNALWTYADRSGHIDFKCRKWKFQGPLNVGYFRRQKRTGCYMHFKRPVYKIDD